MVALLTGDVMESQGKRAKGWLKALKTVLNTYGKSPKTWEIYRGDSFQLEVSAPEKALEAALKIKLSLMAATENDARIAIGIGEKTHSARKITQSNGSAFVFSGQLYDRLEKMNQNLAIHSSWEAFDETMNLCFDLAQPLFESWKKANAEVAKAAFENPEMNQRELGNLLNISQPSVSQALNRAHFSRMVSLQKFFEKRTLHQLQTQ